MDNTGQIKHVRGSGPPMLSVEGESIGINDLLYASVSNSWSTVRPPLACRVIGIDLTRRMVRLQVIGGKEIVYVADSNNKGHGDANYYLFSEPMRAKQHAVSLHEDDVTRTTRAADDKIDDLEKAKSKLAECERWEPLQDDGMWN